MTHDTTLRNLQRRLERWELAHLRKLAAELAERLERAVAEAHRSREESERAWESAETWQRHAMELQQELMAAGGKVGLTQEGALLVLESPREAQLIEAARAAEAVLAKQKWVEVSNDPEAVALKQLRAALANYPTAEH